MVVVGFEEMYTLIDKIKVIELARRKEKLLQGLNDAYEIISAEIKTNHKSIIRDDFELFSSKGRYWVHNTFAGGIIFLREPETIEGIKIDFKTATNKYFNVLILSCTELAINPKSGKEYNEIYPELKGRKTWKHIIFYRELDKQTIEITRILHERMDLKSKFKK